MLLPGGVVEVVVVRADQVGDVALADVRGDVDYGGYADLVHHGFP